MKKKSQAIFATVLLASLCLGVLVYMYYYVPQTNKAKELEATNATLKTRVDMLKVFHEEMPKNLEKIDEAEKDIKGKMFEFASEVREEDIIYMALRAANLKNEDGSNVILPEAPQFDDKGEEIIPFAVRFKDIGVEEYKELGVIPSDMLKKASVEGLQETDADGNTKESDIILQSRTVSYTGLCNYDSLKNMIDIFNDAEDKLSINKLAFSVNPEQGVLEGTVEVLYYAVKGTAKPYKEREFDLYQTGNIKDLFKLEGVLEQVPQSENEDNANMTQNPEDGEEEE